jgi:hypothetical protein
MFGDTMKLCEAMLGITTELFNSVDMLKASDKYIVAVIDAEMFINANVYQTIVATSLVSVKTLLGSTFLLIMPCKVALDALGTISV